MRDGEGTVQIACGKLRREGARQHAGRRGNRGNSLGRALLGGKRGNSLGRSSVGGTETARLLHTETRSHTGGFIQTEDFTAHRTFIYIEQLLRSEACTHRTKGSFFTQNLLHRFFLIHRSFYTQKPLHTEALDAETFTHRNFYTQKLLHKPLHNGAFTHRQVYTEESLRTEAFTQESFFTQKRLHRVVFTQRNLYRKKS